MGWLIFYILNFVGIADYFIFNRRDNANSAVLMVPYMIAAVIIVAAALKLAMSGFAGVSRSASITTVAVGTGVITVAVYSYLRASPGSFDLSACINSMRRYYGSFLIFFACLGIDELFDLRDLKWTSYLKFVAALVAGEALLESILLNTGVISLSNLPIVLGAEGGVGALRPYGFLGATTALGVFLLLIFYLCRGLGKALPRWTWVISFAGFAVTLSLTAYAIFAVISLLLAIRSQRKVHWILATIGVLISIGVLTILARMFIPEKVSMIYLEALYLEVWLKNTDTYFSLIHGIADVIFGAQVFDGNFGVLTQDLPYISWLAEAGLFGVIACSYPIVHYLRRFEAVSMSRNVSAAIACIFLGMIHYPILIFIPMQAFMGSALFFASRLPMRHGRLRLARSADASKVRAVA